ncbi:hypothetical protein TUBRATIS_10760 [Tubulinosema ratisbonensis]|uniref:Ubiquitin-like domain-containing protein n=1 Tax=Tubulinosema ratisbonensis TaxID=291195 RepID=A0A437AMP1_9MICR|nr:hypothetical protein TUBRATIS_10760 [Tubulinosema ratisbonensis]
MTFIKLKYKSKQIKVKIEEKTRVSEIKPIIEKELHFPKNTYSLFLQNKQLQDKDILFVLPNIDTQVIQIFEKEDEQKRDTSPLNFIEKEMDKNSELRQMIQSENFMEEMGKLSNDTNYYNQQAKNADIAMSRLETLPGGINLMNSMVNDISNPLNKFMDQNKGVKDLKGENISNIFTEPIPYSNQSSLNQSVNYLLLYRKELSQLKKIGFTDLRKNLEALKKSQGDLVETVELLTQEGSNGSKREL